MLVGVDLVGQLGVGLLRLVVLAAGAQQFEDLVLVDFHGIPFGSPMRWGAVLVSTAPIGPSVLRLARAGQVRRVALRPARESVGLRPVCAGRGMRFGPPRSRTAYRAGAISMVRVTPLPSPSGTCADRDLATVAGLGTWTESGTAAPPPCCLEAATHSLRICRSMSRFPRPTGAGRRVGATAPNLARPRATMVATGPARTGPVHRAPCRTGYAPGRLTRNLTGQPRAATTITATGRHTRPSSGHSEGARQTATVGGDLDGGRRGPVPGAGVDRGRPDAGSQARRVRDPAGDSSVQCGHYPGGRTRRHIPGAAAQRRRDGSAVR